MEWQMWASVGFTVLSVAANAFAVSAIRHSVHERATSAAGRTRGAYRRTLSRLGVRNYGTLNATLPRLTSTITGSDNLSAVLTIGDLPESVKRYVDHVLADVRLELGRLTEAGADQGQRLADLEAGLRAAEGLQERADKDARAATGWVIWGAVFAVLALVAQVIAPSAP